MRICHGAPQVPCKIIIVASVLRGAVCVSAAGYWVFTILLCNNFSHIYFCLRQNRNFYSNKLDSLFDLNNRFTLQRSPTKNLKSFTLFPIQNQKINYVIRALEFYHVLMCRYSLKYGSVCQLADAARSRVKVILWPHK